MLFPLLAYTAAALSDLKWRTAPNLIWIGLLAYNLYTGVPLVAWAASVYLLVVLYVIWSRWDFGGADVKAIVLLPPSFPEYWPAMLAVGMAIAVVWSVRREEIPLLAPIAAGVILTLPSAFL